VAVIVSPGAAWLFDSCKLGLEATHGSTQSDVPSDVPLDVPPDVQHDVLVDVDVPSDVLVHHLLSDVPVDVPSDEQHDVLVDVPSDVLINSPSRVPVDVPLGPPSRAEAANVGAATAGCPATRTARMAADTTTSPPMRRLSGSMIAPVQKPHL
jgi:hypothetical protein